MQRVGETFDVGGASFVVERIETGQVWARCTRPDPSNALGYAPHQLYRFGDASYSVPRPLRSPAATHPGWWLLGAILAAVVSLWLRATRPTR